MTASVRIDRNGSITVYAEYPEKGLGLSRARADPVGEIGSWLSASPDDVAQSLGMLSNVLPAASWGTLVRSATREELDELRRWFQLVCCARVEFDGLIPRLCVSQHLAE